MECPHGSWDPQPMKFWDKTLVHYLKGSNVKHENQISCYFFAGLLRFYLELKNNSLKKKKKKKKPSYTILSDYFYFAEYNLR